jgi:hypothetical protein
MDLFKIGVLILFSIMVVMTGVYLFFFKDKPDEKVDVDTNKKKKKGSKKVTFDEDPVEDPDSEEDPVEDPDSEEDPVEEQDPPVEKQDDSQKDIIPLIEKEPEEVESADIPTTTTRKMCFYTNVYEMCNAKCGQGKRFRSQVEYKEGMNTRSYGIHPDDLQLHVCKAPDQREYEECTGTNCSDTYTVQTFKDNNPDVPADQIQTKYCEFIIENDACNDPNVRGTGSCRTECWEKWR